VQTDRDLINACRHLLEQGKLSPTDASYAHFIASHESLDFGQQVACSHLLEHYKQQLTDCSIAIPQSHNIKPLGSTAKMAKNYKPKTVTAQRTTYAYLLDQLGDLSAPLPSGRILFQHQRDAVRLILQRGSTILADQMGLGKTTSALVAAKVVGLPVIVIAPASVKDNWLREAEGVGAKISVYSWAKQPEPPTQDFILIGDEAHYCQSLRSLRTQHFLKLAKSQHCKLAILLTGTPCKNGRPVNLFPLLVAIGHPLARSKGFYEKHYCDAKATKYTRWDTSGASHLDELHEKTRDAIIRRTKKECLDLPPKTRVIRHVEMSKEDEKIYAQTFIKLRDEYRERLRRGEIEKGARAVVMLNHLRHAGSVGKAGTAVEIARDVIEEGEQIVLFVAYKETGHIIAKALGCDFLCGDTLTKDRQPMIDRFQNGDKKAIVCSIGAGGVGITLTAAQTVVLVDRPWTPGDTAQVEDRLHRIGQRNAVTSIWLQADKCDKEIDDLLQNKSENISVILSGKELNVSDYAGEILKVVLSDD
jgi:SNF2 family DNA or RNA helicase